MSTSKVHSLPHYHAGLSEGLAAAGHSETTIEALLTLDTEMFVWHRRMMKGELAGRLIAEMGLDLELSQFYALTAISRIQHGVARAKPEPATVGLLADEMDIDPSRASRIASGLIADGWVRREVAQDDGRKSILVLTEEAWSVFGRFRDLKWQKLLKIFDDWEEADIEAFSRLFRRYSEAMARVYSRDEG